MNDRLVNEGPWAISIQITLLGAADLDVPNDVWCSALRQHVEPELVGAPGLDVSLVNEGQVVGGRPDIVLFAMTPWRWVSREECRSHFAKVISELVQPHGLDFIVDVSRPLVRFDPATQLWVEAPRELQPP